MSHTPLTSFFHVQPLHVTHSNRKDMACSLSGVGHASQRTSSKKEDTRPGENMSMLEVPIFADLPILLFTMTVLKPPVSKKINLATKMVADVRGGSIQKFLGGHSHTTPKPKSFQPGPKDSLFHARKEN